MYKNARAQAAHSSPLAAGHGSRLAVAGSESATAVPTLHTARVSRGANRFTASLGVLFFCACELARATSPCVSTSTELQDALDKAHLHPEPYTIRIVASPTPYQLMKSYQFTDMPPDAVIQGGFTQNCADYDFLADAAATVIDVGGYSIEFYPDPAYYGTAQHLEIKNLTLRHGVDFYATAGNVGTFSDDVGEIIINNVRFTDFAGGPPAVGFHAVKGLVQLVNVQFDHLQATGACSVTIFGENDSTFTANFITADLTNVSNRDLCLAASDQSGTLTARIDNSIIWGSGTGTTNIRGIDLYNNKHPVKLSTHNSIYSGFTGWGSITAEDSHIAADPHWSNPAASDYRLADASSPAYNSGIATKGLAAPYYDITHGLRQIGSNPDRGAYESPFDDSQPLVVKSAADSGAQTLRAAIDSANFLGGVHTITFELPACPTVISLATPLSDIKSNVIVDGYTQAGATPNDSDMFFDANICVLIKPATSVSRAFRVPSNANGGSNGSLAMRGLGIGGFDQDVILLGGSNHSISGNQFGGVVNGVDLGTTSWNVISAGVDVNSLVIGGFGPQNRNVIGAASGGFGNGINIQGTVVSDPDHCQIINNWIGLAPDLTPLPNLYGIQLSGSGCAVAGNRFYGNKLVNLWVNGGHDNVIQSNIIADTSGLPNDAFGIRIDGDNNTVGSSATETVPGTLRRNTVTDMAKGGIVVTSGSGNSIRGNYSGYNGPNSDGSGMDIDLGGDGPTGNGSHAPPGPDNWQSFPFINQLSFLDHPPGGINTSAAIGGHLDADPGTYKVDAYYSGSCSPTGRAHAESYVGDVTVTIPAGANSASFTLQGLLPNGTVGNVGLTATSVTGGTSEVGTCFDVDRIFKSGFGNGLEY